MTVFFTSDNHFSHKNIRNFCPSTRQGADHHEMNRIMIQKWQSQVQQHDTVYMLGDVFFCSASDAISLIKQLPGEKHLIFGNHDKVIRSNSELRSHFASTAEWRQIHLPVPGAIPQVRIIDGGRGMDTRITVQKVILHHYPTYEWKDMQKGAFHLYGHIHSRYGETQHPGIDGRCMDVGIDSRPNMDMTLWTWEEVYRILSKRQVRAHHGKVFE